MKKNLLALFIIFILSLVVLPLYAGGQKEAAAPKSITIVGASQLPETHTYYKAMVKFGELLRKYYKGPIEVKVDVHASGDLGQEKDFFEFMMQGTSVDMAFIAPSWMATWSKKAAFMDTPFLWRDMDQYKKGLKAGVFKSIEKDVLAKGVRILGYGGGGKRNLILRKPIHNMEDVHSILLRVMGSPIQARVFNAVGFKATPMAYKEVYNAIKTGVIDGLENEAASLVTMKFYEVAPYIILTHHTLTVRPLCFSEKRLNSFPKDLQEAILKAGAEAADWERETEMAEGDKILKRLSDEGKVKLIEFDTSEMIKLATPVINSYAKELGVEDILAEIRAIK